MGILSIGAALGPRGRVGGAVPRVEQRARPRGRMFLSAGNIRRAAGSPSMDEVRGMYAVHAALGGDLRRRHVRGHGLPAVRAVLQRAADRARRVRDRPRRRGRDVPRRPAARVLRADARRVRHRGRPPPAAREGGRPPLPRDAEHGPAAAAAARDCRCGSASSPPPCCARPGRPPSPSSSPPHERHHALRPAANATALPLGGGARVAGGRVRAAHGARARARRAALRVVRRARGGGRAAGRRARVRRRQHPRRRPQPAVRRRISLAHRDAPAGAPLRARSLGAARPRPARGIRG